MIYGPIVTKFRTECSVLIGKLVKRRGAGGTGKEICGMCGTQQNVYRATYGN